MPRYRITIEYDGTPFSGWQIQATDRSVQHELVDAIAAFSGERVVVRGAGRTDSGVHATGQVAHFDLKKTWQPFRIQEALNYHLRPDPIAIVTCREVPDIFDARFSALARHYRYRILNRRAPPALDAGKVWWVPSPLNESAMHEAAQLLVGHHDFTTFRASQCQAASPIKTLDRLVVTRHDNEVIIKACARSFLHNQVRSLVGTLKHVGEGKWTSQHVAKALAAKDRKACGMVAPPTGLYLVHVDYPADEDLEETVFDTTPKAVPTAD
ncbi:MAG: tRNA pseudouridine(38-40) synthase TruA [Pseudomonadota bacterium]